MQKIANNREVFFGTKSKWFLLRSPTFRTKHWSEKKQLVDIYTNQCLSVKLRYENLPTFLQYACSSWHSKFVKTDVDRLLLVRQVKDFCAFLQLAKQKVMNST